MSGRIREEDIAYVRQHAQIDDIVGDYVQLKNAGGGQKKGGGPSEPPSRLSEREFERRDLCHLLGCSHTACLH